MAIPFSTTTPPEKCIFCQHSKFEKFFDYNKAPKIENRFPIEGDYKRRVFRCEGCGHFYSIHQMKLDGLYHSTYVDTIYGAEGLLRSFKRIMSLRPEASDNMGRVQRIQTFAKKKFIESGHPLSLLDIGSGLAVFPFAMQQLGWNCTAIDPDSRAAEHAEKVAKVNSICGEFPTPKIRGRFDAITLNKVLEHVKDPVDMLAQCRNFLKDSGFIYLELPDGTTAAATGSDRQEFGIEHHHIFSTDSIRRLVHLAGFKIQVLETVHEPSDKFTIRAFLTA